MGEDGNSQPSRIGQREERGGAEEREVREPRPETRHPAAGGKKPEMRTFVGTAAREEGATGDWDQSVFKLKENIYLFLISFILTCL